MDNDYKNYYWTFKGQLWSWTKVEQISIAFFDCKAFVYIPDTKWKSKLDKKSITSTFVGYPTTENGLKLFNPQTKQIS